MTNNESLTLGEFVAESSNFQYSESYYELLKESSELALMELYAETSSYLAENAEEVAKVTGLTFMAEAADPEKADGIKNKINAKKAGLLEKIGNAFKKAWKAIVAFFARIKNVFTNSQGKQIAELNKKIDQILRDSEYTEEQLTKKWKKAEAHIKELVAKVQAHEDEIAVLSASKSAAESKIAALNEKFKGINPEIYKELKKIEAFLSEDYVIRAPKIVSKIEDISERVSNVIRTYESAKASSTNKARSLKVAREVAALLDDIKESRVQFEDMRVSAAWLNEVYESVKDSHDKAVAAVDALMEDIKGAEDTSSVRHNDPTVAGIRRSTDKNFGEFARNITFLLAEYKAASADVIKLLGAHIEKRSAAIRIEAQLLNSLASA